MYKILDKLLPEEEIEKLQKAIIHNEVYFYNDRTSFLKTLLEMDTLISLDSLISNWESEVDVHLLDLKDEASTKKVSTKEAKTYFNDGMGLLFNDINQYDPIYQKMLDELAFDIGISNASISRNLIYATPRGGGTSTHFDQNINLIIQVHGEKTWWIRENESIENPLTRHTLGTLPDSEMASYLENDFPDSVGFDKSYELTPGSILFVPRGHWHKTYAKSEALALNFTFSVPSWADIIAMALRPRIIQSPYWREMVLGLNDQSKAVEKISQFQGLIDSLKEDIQSWKAEDILGFVEYTSSNERDENE